MVKPGRNKIMIIRNSKTQINVRSVLCFISSCLYVCSVQLMISHLVCLSIQLFYYSLQRNVSRQNKVSVTNTLLFNKLTDKSVRENLYLNIPSGISFLQRK